MKTRAIGPGPRAVLAVLGARRRRRDRGGAPKAGAPRRRRREARLPGYLEQLPAVRPGLEGHRREGAETACRASRPTRSSARASTRSSRSTGPSTSRDDGKWFFDGDTIANPDPKPVRERRRPGLARGPICRASTARAAKAALCARARRGGPEGRRGRGRDGLRAGAHARLRHRRTARGSSAATLWDFQMDPREERKKRIDLSQAALRGQRPTARSRSSSTPTWSAGTAATAACRWTRCSRPTPGRCPTSATTSSSRSGSPTPGR